MQNTPRTTRLSSFIFYFLRRQKVGFSFLTIISLMWAVEQVLFPYVVKLIIDAISSYEGDRADVYSVLSTPLWLGAAVWAFSIAAWRTADIVDYYFTPRFQANIRAYMTTHVFGHSQRYFSEHLAGSIANKVGDMVHGVHYLVTHTIRFFLPNLVAILATAGVMATISPAFGIILLGWTVIHLFICAWYSRQCDAMAHQHSEVKSNLQGRIVDSVSNFITVRLFARKDHELSYIQRFQQDEIKAHRRMLFTIAKVRAILEIPCLAMIIIELHFLIKGWQQGIISTGDTAFILMTTINLMYILWRVGMEFPAFYREIGVCQQALSLINEAHEITDREGAKPLKISEGRIDFDNVAFEYNPGQNLFHNTNITILPGQKVGLVGFSGSGKSSFVNLILRLYELKAGRITIDAQDIASVTQDSLREQIALIPQDPVLFHRSLRENIAYAKPTATDAEIHAAAQAAHCHEFIMATSKGYDAIVGERGVKLSGGQRQRIAIARAILKDARILIFDEATSSLDSFTEAAIQGSMRAMMQGRSTIVIAHRLSTLTAMDRLLVFKDGSIIEDGTHESLLAKGRHYAMLWNMQVGGFLPDQPEMAAALAG
jgi:ATP-binding cassette subfamily B protein